MNISKLAQSTDFNLQDLKQIYENLAKENNKTGEHDIKHKHSKSLSKLFILLQNLDKPLQNNLLETWTKMNLPLREKNIVNLMNYLDNNSLSSLTDKKSVIKAFAYLIKNDLPLQPKLIKGISQNINPDTSLTKTINSYSFSEVSTQNNIKNMLALNLQLSPARLNTELKNYSQKIIEAISLLKNNSDNKNIEIMENLLGQQTLNIKESIPGNNLLLTLEIPVQIFNNKQLHPFYLQIENYYESKKEQSEANKGFKISFIIELPEIGKIKSNIKIKGKTISSHFLTDSENTSELIRNNFHLLQDKLEQLGYNIRQPLIKQIQENEFEGFIPHTNDTKFSKGDKNNAQEYIHIDIKI